MGREKTDKDTPRAKRQASFMTNTDNNKKKRDDMKRQIIC